MHLATKNMIDNLSVADALLYFGTMMMGSSSSKVTRSTGTSEASYFGSHNTSPPDFKLLEGYVMCAVAALPLDIVLMLLIFFL